MPNLNRRGPNGEGPRTGRGLGRCNPENKGKTDEEILCDRTENDSNQEIFYGRGRQLGYGWARIRQRKWFRIRTRTRSSLGPKSMNFVKGCMTKRTTFL
jgi:hypothetical protein